MVHPLHFCAYNFAHTLLHCKIVRLMLLWLLDTYSSQNAAVKTAVTVFECSEAVQ